MFQFNIQLFLSLASVIGVNTDAELREAIGLSNTAWYNVKYKSDIRMSTLMDICERFNLNLSAFFTEDGKITCEITTDTPCTYRFAWKNSSYVTTSNKLPKSWSELMPKNVAFTTRQRYLRPDSTSSITAAVVADICNHHKLHPSQFWTSTPVSK